MVTNYVVKIFENVCYQNKDCQFFFCYLSILIKKQFINPFGNKMPLVLCLTIKINKYCKGF